jgi:hypothetical protein
MKSKKDRTGLVTNLLFQPVVVPGISKIIIWLCKDNKIQKIMYEVETKRNVVTYF